MSETSEFLEYLKDPVGASIVKGVAEFEKRWAVNIDVLNLFETEGRTSHAPRHWLVHVYTTDTLLIRSFQDSLIYYATKHHPTAWITTGIYIEDSCVLPMGILEWKP